MLWRWMVEVVGIFSVSWEYSHCGWRSQRRFEDLHEDSKCYLYPALPCMEEQEYSKYYKISQIWQIYIQYKCKIGSSMPAKLGRWITEAHRSSKCLNKCLRRTIAVFWLSDIKWEAMWRNQTPEDWPADRKRKLKWLGHIHRGHGREAYSVAAGEEPAKKRQQQLGGPGNSWGSWLGMKINGELFWIPYSPAREQRNYFKSLGLYIKGRRPVYFCIYMASPGKIITIVQ